ncbi:hypothetical protein [Lactobacillus delbrueckii]|nr:hypothetical protein [Lactobacillus delbrueckii]
MNTLNTFICTGASIFYNESIPKAARMTAYLNGCKEAWIPCLNTSSNFS